MDQVVRDWLKENDKILKDHNNSEPMNNHMDRIKWKTKSRNLEFNLTIDDFECPDVCPILGIPISRKLGRSNWPSLDRVNNSKGYIKGNVRIISHKANTMKNDNTLETLEKIIQYMKGEL